MKEKREKSGENVCHLMREARSCDVHPLVARLEVYKTGP